MQWRELLSKIGVCNPPLSALVQASADRLGVVNRRAFLGLAGAAVAGLALDPEALLWTPSAKTILLPQPVVLVGNQIVTPVWVMKEIERGFVNNLKFAEQVYRQYDASIHR